MLVVQFIIQWLSSYICLPNIVFRVAVGVNITRACHQVTLV